MASGAFARVRQRARQKAMDKLLFWLEGPGMVPPLDPRQRIALTGPAWPTFKSLDVDPTEGGGVTLGRYSGMHYTVTIAHGGEHHTDWVGLGGGWLENGQFVRAPNATYSNGPVIIGNDVWIGYEALIMSGVSIGDGAAIGARSVVRRSVEPYAVVAGNPARQVGFRFDEPTREALLRIKWWDWPDDKVTAHGHEINSSDVAGFVQRHDPQLGPPSCPLCTSSAK